MEWSQLVKLALLFGYQRGSNIADRDQGIMHLVEMFEGIWSAYKNDVSCRTELPYTRFGSDLGGGFTIDVFIKTRACEATDPRDRVYAFLDFLQAPASPLSNESRLVVDYTKTVEQVYIELAQFVIETQPTDA